MFLEHQGIEKEPIHRAVLVQETLNILQPRSGGKYLDGTVGLGGHAFAILEIAGAHAELCGLDQDQQALTLAAEKLKVFENRVHLIYSRYSNFNAVLDSLGWDYLDGVLIDIGISSLQLGLAERGFSFLLDGSLDMRMDQNNQKVSAAEIVNTSKEETLKKIITQYGEDPQAYKIAKAIVNARKIKPIETTKELAFIIEQAYPRSWVAKARNHPATRTFQALRMTVNSELDELTCFLDKILSYIVPGGRLVVISFHSLEDKLVKQYMKSWERSCICPLSVPKCICSHKQEAKILTSKPICPSKKEIFENSRARSAKLRAVEKCIPGKLETFSSKERYEMKKAKRLGMKDKV